MNFVTVDSRRRVTLPKELKVKAGQVMGVTVRDDKAEFYLVQMVPSDEFQKILEIMTPEQREAVSDLSFMPSKETEAAMRETRKSGRKTYGSVDGLFEALNA